MLRICNDPLCNTCGSRTVDHKMGLIRVPPLMLRRNLLFDYFIVLGSESLTEGVRFNGIKCAKFAKNGVKIEKFRLSGQQFLYILLD
jgi:hypothetical protein